MVDARDTDVGEILAVYTDLIESAFALNDEAFTWIAHGRGARVAAGIAAIERAKDAAGRARALGAVGFGRGGFDLRERDRFLAFVAVQRSALARALAYVEEVRPDLVPQSMVARQEVKRLRDRVRKTRPGEAIPDVSATEWWAASTVWIDRLRSFEEAMVITLYRTAEERQRSAANRVAAWSIWMAVSFLAAAASPVLIRQSARARPSVG